MIFVAAGAMGAAWLALAARNRQLLSGLAYCLAATLAMIGLTSA